MRLHSVSQSNLFYAYQINQSADRQRQEAAGLSKTSGRDTVMISRQGRNNNRIRSLIKQKMDIMEQKESLMSSVKKDGSSTESVKSQLEFYDEQLENIDKQIAEAMAKEMEKEEEKIKGQKSNKPKTKEEIQNQRLADIANLSNGLEQAKVVDSVKTRVDGEARVLETEIELDKMYDAPEQAIAEKEMELSAIKKESAELMSAVGEKVSETAEEVKDNNEINISEETF